MNAIESEYQMNISEETVATDQLEKSHIAAPGSIVNRFLIGNLETLKRPNIIEELKKYHEKNYSSNRMSLVLVGKQSIQELKKMAEENFSGIANKQVEEVDYSKEVVFTKEHSFGRIFKVIPGAHIRQISLIWKMPSSAKTWRSKSPQYLSHVFGHEGPNSLFSLLVKEGLATWISSGSSQKLS